jgi:uncharacterized protein YndB with AHSA1/START domain
MPIKKDGTGKRWVEMELLLPGTPEQVWHAMATGPGYSAWFTKAEIEPRIGGQVRFDFGSDVTSSGEVTRWEPPNQFSYVERGWEKGAPPLATEIIITGRSGDRCLVRMVHSLFASSDDWDDPIEGFEAGWPGFFAVLRSYLTHFNGASAASFIARTQANTDSLSAWPRLCERLGLAGANVGERRIASSAPAPWSGVVEHVHQDAQQRYVLFRLDAPSPGVILAGTDEKAGSTSVSLCHFFYGENAAALASQSEPRTQEWLNQSFGA